MLIKVLYAFCNCLIKPYFSRNFSAAHAAGFDHISRQLGPVLQDILKGAKTLRQPRLGACVAENKTQYLQ